MDVLHKTDKPETASPTSSSTAEAPLQGAGALPFKLLADPHLPRIPRQQIARKLNSMVGNRATQNMLQLRRTRHEGVLDNGVLTQDVDVVLGNLSGILPNGTYVEVISGSGTPQYRVRVWSGYGGQETTIPAAAFTHEDQRDDSVMDRADMGAYGRVPVARRLPFLPSTQFSERAERHEGVQDNGRLTANVGATLGGFTGVLPRGTYIEVLRANPDGSRVVRVWSGYGGQETTLTASVFAASFAREQVVDSRMNIPDLAAYALLAFEEQIPLADSVRLQVIDNGVITTAIDTTNAAVLSIPAGTYVEILEYRDHLVVFRPHSGRGAADARDRFLTAEQSVFVPAFRHQPQIADVDTSGRPDRAAQELGVVDSRVEYQQRTEPLWGPSGPQLEDIRQGNIGTCGVLSAAGALIHQNPSILKDRVFRNNNPAADTFQVHLFPDAMRGISVGNERVITIDRYLPAWVLARPGRDSAAYGPQCWRKPLPSCFKVTIISALVYSKWKR